MLINKVFNLFHVHSFAVRTVLDNVKFHSLLFRACAIHYMSIVNVNCPLCTFNMCVKNDKRVNLVAYVKILAGDKVV